MTVFFGFQAALQQMQHAHAKRVAHGQAVCCHFVNLRAAVVKQVGIHFFAAAVVGKAFVYLLVVLVLHKIGNQHITAIGVEAFAKDFE